MRTTETTVSRTELMHLSDVQYFCTSEEDGRKGEERLAASGKEMRMLEKPLVGAHRRRRAYTCRSRRQINALMWGLGKILHNV